MWRWRELLAVWSVCLVCPAVASAYSISLTDGAAGEVVRWHTSEVTYRLNSAGSADIVDGSDLNAARAGFAEWNGVGCANIHFSEGSPTQNKAIMSVGAAPNGQNEVAWIENSAWGYGQFVLGITNTSFYSTGEIVEADIAFNGYLNKWSTTGKPGTVDVLNVAVHEEGHFFGAQHNLGGWDPNDPPTMSPTADPYLKSQTIEADDKNCICFLYPTGAYPCSGNADCPLVLDTNAYGEEDYVAQITCQSGICGGKSFEIPEGTQILGEPCASKFDCKKPLFCQATGPAGSVCAKNCDTAADCGAGFACFPYSNSAGGVCLPSSGGGGGGGPVATKEAGEACGTAQECKSGLCVGGAGATAYYCRDTCQLGGVQCAAGETCLQLQGSSQGACLPGQGGGASLGPGEACESPAECISGLCVGNGPGSYRCRDACSPAINDCPELHACFQLAGGAGGACIPVDPKRELGATCEGDIDCVSDFCLGVSGDAGFYCSMSCGGGAACPCGMSCSNFVGGEAYCTLNGETACTPSGNACENAEECVSGTCISGICRDPCQVMLGGCPPGQGCKRFKAGSSVGVCAAVGAAEEGAACGSDGDCERLFCNAGVCLSPCDVATTFCGDGRLCLGLDGTAMTVCADDPGAASTGGGTTGSAAGGATGDGGGGTDGGGQATSNGGGAAGDSVGGASGDSRGGGAGCSASPSADRAWALALLLALTLLIWAWARRARRRA